MRSWAVVALPWFAAACIGSRSHEVPRYHVLDPSPPHLQAKATRATTLLVEPTTAASFYDTQEMVYSPARGVRAYYQFNRWTEAPSQRIHELLLARLRHDGAFRTVSDETTGVRGRFLLATHVTELYHDAVEPPGAVRVTVVAELKDDDRHEVLGRRTFSHSSPAGSYDAAGAAQALGVAVAAVLDDVVGWVDATAPR